MSRILWVILGVGTLLLPALPIARWVGAADRGPEWTINLTAWLLGLLVIGMAAYIGGRVAAQRPIKLKVPTLTGGLEPVVVAGLAVLVVVGGAFTMWWAFAGNPHSVDEMAQLFQARVFASGSLTAPPPAPPEAFLFLQTWITPSGWTSQFPPGHALLLAAGLAMRLEWLVNPILGGVGLLLVYRLAHGWYGRRTALLAAVLWAASAWVIVMSATYMNHAAAVVFALGAWTFAMAVRRPRWPHYLGAGVFLGALVATRPLDAVAAAIPILVWLLTRRRVRALLWIGAGSLPLVLAFGYFNWRVFGHPLELGYLALYGEQQRLGFHTDVYGNAFTPTIALSNLSVAVRRLHIYLFEWPIPALLPFAVWAVLAKHRHPVDFPLAVGIAAVPLLYFFYWHSGFYPGPRFYYLAAPLLVIGTARAFWWAMARLKRHAGAVRWDTALAAAASVTIVWSAIGLTPGRIRAFRTEFLPSLKLHPERELATHGVENALVLVPESWGARLIVQLWALGVNPGLAERAYRWLGACELADFAQSAQERGVGPQEAERELAALMARADRPAARVPDWPDRTLRLRSPGGLTPLCRMELERDLAGFAVYGNLAWRNAVGLDRGIVFARDLFEENDQLLSRYRGWDVWRYAPPTDNPGEPPVLKRVTSRVSLEQP